VTAGLRDLTSPGPVRGGVRTDARTKLALLVLFAAATALSPSRDYEIALMIAAAAFALLSGRRLYPIAMLGAYTLVVVGMALVADLPGSAVTSMVMSFFMLVRKVFPSALIAGVVVATTRVGEFMAALGRLRAPRTIVIPLAVMLRYVPVIAEDWRHLSEAMRIRGVSPSPLGLIRAPVRTLECLYVPMLMSASNVADELSVAAVARGIENPQPRTCLVPIAFRGADAVVLVLALALLAAALVPWSVG
jgi:energy-coupling factor transport system permease protein